MELSTFLRTESFNHISVGSDTANFASQRLHTIMKNQPSFRNGDYRTAIKWALAETDKQLFDLSRLGRGDAISSGSTVALCLVNLTSNSVLVANLGDSHVLLGEPSTIFRKCSVVCKLLILCKILPTDTYIQ